MKGTNEIINELWGDWLLNYTKTTPPDESNMGDVAEWAVRNYLKNLLGIYPCNFCDMWFPHESALCLHLMDKHNTKILDTDKEWNSGYGEYSNAYYVYNNSKEEK